MSDPFQYRSCFVMLVLLITSGLHAASQTYLSINFKLVFLYHRDGLVIDLADACAPLLKIPCITRKRNWFAIAEDKNPQTIIQLFAALFYFQNIFQIYTYPAVWLCSSISCGSALVFQTWSIYWRTCFRTEFKGFLRNLSSLKWWLSVWACSAV